MAKLHVKKGDLVLVIAGKDKGKTGKVLSVNPVTSRVIVEGVNFIVKHKKARTAQDQGGIIKREGKMHVSNVQVIDPVTNKATRVYHKLVDGKMVRVSKAGNALDAGVAKTTKKSTKKAPAKKAEVKIEEKVEEVKAPAKKASTTTAKKAPAKKTASASKAKTSASKPAAKKASTASTTKKASTASTAKKATSTTAKKTTAKKTTSTAKKPAASKAKSQEK